MIYILPDLTKANVNDVLYISGWGKTDNIETIAEKLRIGQVTLTDFDDCRSHFDIGTPNINRENFLCTKSAVFDICKGDSGGTYIIIYFFLCLSYT